MKQSFFLHGLLLAVAACSLLSCRAPDNTSILSAQTGVTKWPLALRLYTGANHQTPYTGPLTIFIYGDDGQSIERTVEREDGSEIQLNFSQASVSFTLLYEAHSALSGAPETNNKQLLHSFLKLSLDALPKQHSVSILNINTRRTPGSPATLARDVSVHTLSRSLPLTSINAPSYYQLAVDFGDLQNVRSPDHSMGGRPIDLSPDCPISFVNGSQSLFGSSVLDSSSAEEKEQSVLAMVLGPADKELIRYGYLLDQSIEDDSSLNIALENIPARFNIEQQGFSLPLADGTLADGSLASRFSASVSVIGVRNGRQYRLNPGREMKVFPGQFGGGFSTCAGLVNTSSGLSGFNVATEYPALSYYRRIYFSRAKAVETLNTREGFSTTFSGNSCLLVENQDIGVRRLTLEPPFLELVSSEYLIAPHALGRLTWESVSNPNQLKWMTARLWPQGRENSLQEDFWLIEFEPTDDNELLLPALPEALAYLVNGLSPQGGYRLKLGFYNYQPAAGELAFEYSIADAQRERQFCEGFTWRVAQAPLG